MAPHTRILEFFRGEDLDVAQRDGGVEIRRVGVIVGVGTLASVVFHLILAAMGRGWPYSTFLYRPRARFFDFLEVYGNAFTFGNSGDVNVSYSAPFHLLTVALTVAPSVVAWLAVVAVFLVALVLVAWGGITARVGARTVRDAYTVIFCLCSYPVLFLLDRGNLEMVVFVLLAWFVYLYYARRSRWAWLPLALAIAGKYVWLVLLVLLIADRRWRQAAYAAVGGLGVTVVSAAILGSMTGRGLAGILGGTASTLGGHLGSAASATAIQNGHSFLAIPFFVDRVAGYWLWDNLDVRMLYAVVAAGVFALVVLRLLRYEVEAWRKLTAVLVCAIALPFESHDYTLVHLLLPLALVGAWGAKSGRAWLYVVVFGLLLIPLDYVQFVAYGVSSSSLGYAVLLAVLLVSVLTDGARLRAGPFWREDSTHPGTGETL